MKIMADCNIPYVEEGFSDLGQVYKYNGRELASLDVRDADVLLVRSVTRVDDVLLNGSSVRFVGSATIGTDHVDLEYLRRQNIGFANAPGSNAVSAAEYVVAVLLEMSQLQSFHLHEKKVGIVGYGNVGSRVCTFLEALGVTCLVNDPPRERRYSDREYSSLSEVLRADIVTVHVPLSYESPDATFHLFDQEKFAALPKNALFVNTSRGSVVDESGLAACLQHRKDLHLVLDVWENEPDIDSVLLEKVILGTPHIAGYSLDGKVRGTEMIYKAACDFFELQSVWKVPELALPTRPAKLVVAPTDSDSDVIHASVSHAYDINQDHQSLNKVKDMSTRAKREHFDSLRKQYPVRREFPFYSIQLGSGRRPLAEKLQKLGFNVFVE